MSCFTSNFSKYKYKAQVRRPDSEYNNSYKFYILIARTKPLSNFTRNNIRVENWERIYQQIMIDGRAEI